jgi:hypothetical protein
VDVGNGARRIGGGGGGGGGGRSFIDSKEVTEGRQVQLHVWQHRLWALGAQGERETERKSHRQKERENDNQQVTEAR